jgi:hypothetical protein
LAGSWLRRLASGLALCACLVGIAALAEAARSGVDPANLPIGDGKYSTTTPQRGYIYLCHATAGGGGAPVQGPWIHSDGTWDSTSKAVVDGSVAWPDAFVSIVKHGASRTISSNDLPTNHTTGTFPIQPSDDAYQYDPNPGSIAPNQQTYVVPSHPVKGPPQCIGGEVGVATNGVHIFDGLDALLRDAPAHEVQDHCDGHPNNAGYHYHSIPRCLYAGESPRKQSGLVGFAYDGFPIYGPRGKDGKRLTDADLDVCHGTTSKVRLDGKKQRIYHYVATREYPYTVGCFRGTVIAANVPR